MTTPEPAQPAQPAQRMDAHAGRDAAFRHLGADDIPSDLSRGQRTRIETVTKRFNGSSLQRRRVSRPALAAKVKAVGEALASGNPRWAASALEDLASTCVAYASWIRANGLHEGRRPRG